MRLSCLARNGRSPGEESLSDAVAAQAIEAQPSSGQISQREAVGPRRTASSGEDVADLEGPAQESRHARRRERGRSVGKGRHPIRRQPVQRQCPQPSRLRRRRDRGGLVEAVERGQGLSLPQARRPELHRAIFADLSDDEDGENHHPRRSCDRKPTAECAVPSTGPCPADGGINSAMRAKAVRPTATAPAAAKTCCQSPAGTPMPASAKHS
jgi:hypothetical protein